MAAPKKATTRKPKEPMHPLVPKFVPGEQYEGYVDRQIAGVWALDILHAARNQGHNVALFGPTGSAKTTCVYAYGHREGLPVVNVPCNGAVDTDALIGGWRPLPDGSFHPVPGPLYYVARYGGIGLFDEISMMPPKVAAFVFPWLDARRMAILPDFEGADGFLDKMGNPIEAEFKLHADFMMCSTWNPDYVGTYAMNEALENRFAHRLIFDYSPIVEAELVTSESLIEMCNRLRQSDDIRTPVSTNKMVEFEDNAIDEALGFPYAIENFLAAFKPDERPVVREVIDQYVDTIWKEMSE